jgi:small subunit ribosomal protein S1
MTDPDKPLEQQPAEQAPTTPPTAPPSAEEGTSAEPQSPPAAEAPPGKKDLVQRFLSKGKKQHVPAKVPFLGEQQALFEKTRPGNLDDDLEKELEEAMGDFSDGDMFAETAGRGKKPGEGGALKGKIYRVHGQDVFVDVPGGRAQGVLPLIQFPEGPPQPGAEIDVHIDGFDRANGLILLSRKGAAVEADWSSVSRGMIVEARVVETNKGGLTVDVNGIRGFMPISQIDLYRVENAEQFVNQKLRCMVAEVDPVERNLVVSRRDLLEKEREEQREKLWQELHEGQVFTGIVRKVLDFGAFVDLGGVDGLLHVSELSWTRVKDARDVIQPGESVKVVVQKLDRERRKVSLGHKELLASPWDDAEAKYPSGAKVSGTVTRTEEYGAFVELEPAIEGLIHISELAPQRVRRVTDIVHVGQPVEVVVLSVDVQQRRISLSLKQALPEAPSEESAEGETPEPEEKAPPRKPPRPRTTPLRGGIGDSGGSPLIG